MVKEAKQSNIKYIDKSLLFLTVILFAFGLLMILSSSNVSTFFRYRSAFYSFFIQQGIVLFISLIGFFIAINIPFKNLNKFAKPVMLILFGLLIYLLIKSSSINNAKAWINLKYFSFQPSEAMKIIYIIVAAFYYDKYKDKLNDKRYAFTPLIIGGIICLLIALQKDLGTMFIFFIITIFMFMINPVSIKFKKIVLKLLFIMSLLIILMIRTGFVKYFVDESKIARLDPRKPCSNEKFKKEGNQLCNSYIAINNGKMFGKGLTKSTQKYLYLAESHTDFIFAIIAEETGFIGVFLVIFFFALLLLKIIIIGESAKTNAEKLICYGVFIYIGTHIILNIGGISGILPMTGIPLPFMSYGGSFALSLCASLTVVQMVAINNKKARKVVKNGR